MTQHLWETIAESLKGAIHRGELSPGFRLPAETDLAKEWGVSRMTAHRAMRELQSEGLVERRPRVGTVVATRSRLRNVAVLVYHPGQFPQANYLQGMAAALPKDCELRLCDTGDSPEREAALLRSLVGRTDGILIYPTGAPGNSALLAEVSARVPMVCVDRAPDGVTVDAVTTDEVGSSLAGLRLLTDAGHSRIAHFTDDTLHLSSVRGRADAYLAALAGMGTLGTQWLRTFPSMDHWSFDRLADAVHEAFSAMGRGPTSPTAVFCAHDQYLAAVLASADRQGLRVPEDLAVLSVIDSPSLPILGLERVHRIVPRTADLGRIAAERLALRAADPSLPPEVVRLPSNLLPAL